MMANVADEYEEFIASILEGVEDSARKIRSLGFGRNNKLTGITGQSHQIDVSFVDGSFSEETLVLVECKRWKDTVGVDVIKVLCYNGRDLAASAEHPNEVLLIVASTSGFSSGAKRIAASEGVRLLTVNHGPPFGFNYENIIFAGVAEHLVIGESVTVEIEGPVVPEVED